MPTEKNYQHKFNNRLHIGVLKSQNGEINTLSDLGLGGQYIASRVTMPSVPSDPMKRCLR
jgi:hypothetical protein